MSQVGSHQSHLPYEDDQEYEQKILKLKSKELNSKFELKEGKGEVQVLQWKGKQLENTFAQD